MENGNPDYTGTIIICSAPMPYEGRIKDGKHFVQTINKEDLGEIVTAEGKTKSQAKDNLEEAVIRRYESAK